MQPGLIRRLDDYYLENPLYNKDMERAVCTFFNIKKPELLADLTVDVMTEGWFNEWLSYEFKLTNGQTLLEDFNQRNPLELSEAELRPYQVLQANVYSIFEIVDIRYNSALYLRDIFSGLEYEVRERRGTHQATIGYLLYTRVGRIDDHYELVGADGLQVPCVLTERLRASLVSQHPNKKLTPRDAWQLYSAKSNPAQAFTAWATNDADDGQVTAEQAEAQLTALLQSYGLDQYIDVPLIKRWIYELPKGEAGAHDWSYLTLTTSLLPPDIAKGELETFVLALNAVYHHTPQRWLGGKSPAAKTREPRTGESPIIMSEIPILSADWYRQAKLAHDYTLQNKPVKALEAYNETFNIFLRDRNTMPEVYRVFANKAFTHFALGERAIGERILALSLELNPNYDFALKLTRDLAEGVFDDLIQTGFLENLSRRLADKNNPLQRWDLEAIEKSWPIAKIIKQLADFGVPVTESEFRSQARSFSDAEQLADKLWQPRYTGPDEDCDFIWMAALALFKRWVPEQLTIQLWRDTIDTLEAEVFKKRPKTEIIASGLMVLERFITEAPQQLWDDWRKSVEFSYAATLADCAIAENNTERAPRWYSICARVGEVTGYQLSQLPVIAAAYNHGDVTWQEQFTAMVAGYAADAWPWLSMAHQALQKKDYVVAEVVALQGLAAVAEWEQTQTKRLITAATLYECYQDLLEFLLELYKTTGESKKRADVKQRLTEIDGRSNELEHTTVAEAIMNVMAEGIRAVEEEQFKIDPAYLYFKWLQPFAIRFATPELTTSEVTYQRSGTPLGRNEPCGCDSGKKFKKCHGT